MPNATGLALTQDQIDIIRRALDDAAGLHEESLDGGCRDCDKDTRNGLCDAHQAALSWRQEYLDLKAQLSQERHAVPPPELGA